MSTPLFSLGIITYNSEKTIAETLESLAVLKGLADVELIVTDDASVDQTRSLVDRWLDEHSSLFHSTRRVYLETNQGISKAHTAAFASATGTWGLYLGGDDLIVEPEFFPQLAQRLRTEDGHFYRTLVKEYYSETGVVNDYSDGYHFMRRLSAARQFRYLAGTGYPFRSGPGTVFRNATLRSLDGFGTYNPAFEDWQLYLRFTRAGYRIGFADVEGILWRRHSGQFSSTSQDRMKRGNALVRRTEIVPYLERLSLFERWKYRNSGYVSTKLNGYYRKYLEWWGKMFHE